MKTKNEYREYLADMFMSAIEEKGLNWKKGWQGAESPKSAITGTPYKGVNRFALEMVSLVNQYEDPRWATYRQIQDKGWSLERGAKGVQIEYWVPIHPETSKTTTWDVINKLKETKPDILIQAVPQYYYVFNAEKIKGIPEREIIHNPDIKMENVVPKIAQNMGVEIMNDGGSRAFYRLSEDKVHLPKAETFKTSYDYYATAMHELAHASGAAHRLNRDMSGSFGTTSYAFEELVAEMSSAFMSEHLPYELPEEHLDNHKAYLNSWMKAIKDNPDYLIQAIKKADACANYLEEMGEIHQELQKELQPEKSVANEINYDDFVKSHVQMLNDKTMDKPTLVISAYGGPGAGKTTACLQVTEELKKAGYVAEYVQEYAKELVWEEKWNMLNGTEEHQFDILKEQLNRLDRLYGKVDFIVTDASVLLNGIYNNELTPEYEKMLSQLYEQYNTTEFFVERDASQFEQEGRIHNLEQSIEKDAQMKEFLAKNDISYNTYNYETISDITKNAINQYQGINVDKPNMTMEQRYTEALKIAGYEIIPTPEGSPATVTIRNLETGYELGSDGWGGIAEHLESITIQDATLQEKYESLIHPQDRISFYTENLGGTGLGNDAIQIQHPDFESALKAYQDAGITDGKTIGFMINGEQPTKLAYFNTVDMKNHIEGIHLIQISDEISLNEAQDISEKKGLIQEALGKENAYAQVLGSYNEFLSNSQSVFKKNQSLWLSYARIANNGRPQDYIQFEISGDNKSNEITATLTTVHANDVVDMKQIEVKLSEGDFNQSLERAFRDINSYFTKENSFVRDAIYSLDTDYDKSFKLYAPFVENDIDKHYQALANRGYEAFPNYDNINAKLAEQVDISVENDVQQNVPELREPVLQEPQTPELISEKKTELIRTVVDYDLQKMELQKEIDNFNQNIEDVFKEIAVDDISKNGFIGEDTKQLMKLYGVEDKPFLDNVQQIDSAKGDIHIFQDKTDSKKNYLGKKVEHNGVKVIKKMSDAMDLKSAREQLKESLQRNPDRNIQQGMKQPKPAMAVGRGMG